MLRSIARLMRRPTPRMTRLRTIVLADQVVLVGRQARVDRAGRAVPAAQAELVETAAAVGTAAAVEMVAAAAIVVLLVRQAHRERLGLADRQDPAAQAISAALPIPRLPAPKARRCSSARACSHARNRCIQPLVLAR